MQHEARHLIQGQFTWQRIAVDLATRYRDIVEKACTWNRPMCCASVIRSAALS
jgi:hypothetical protein